ncbi:DUF1304 domain-containing protein [Myxococcaceae bacterium GXIMD 01537]
MSPLVQVLAVIAALIHVLFFVMESILFSRPQVWRRFGLKSQADADVLKRMAFNQGFYNLFLAVGVVAGVVLVHTGALTSGLTAVVFGCASMVAAALVLVSSSRTYVMASIVQGGLPLVALALIAL